MVSNVLRVDNSKSRANSVSQTLYTHHVTLLSRRWNCHEVVRPTSLLAWLNHSINFICTQRPHGWHIVHGIRTFKMAFNLECTPQNRTHNHAVPPAASNHLRLRH